MAYLFLGLMSMTFSDSRGVTVQMEDFVETTATLLVRRNLNIYGFRILRGLKQTAQSTFLLSALPTFKFAVEILSSTVRVEYSLYVFQDTFIVHLGCNFGSYEQSLNICSLKYHWFTQAAFVVVLIERRTPKRTTSKINPVNYITKANLNSQYFWSLPSPSITYSTAIMDAREASSFRATYYQ